jgi:hypothetical protein
MSVKYVCPECEAVLRPSKPVPAGRKIRCPKCESIFAATPAGAAPAEARDKPGKIRLTFDDVAAISDQDDEDTAEEGEIRGYRVESGHSLEEQDEEAKKQKVHYGDLRHKFEKRKRGPAMAKVVTPANILLWEGATLCLGGLGLVIYAIWPMVFNEEALSSQRQKEQFLLMGGGVLGFVYGALICVGASKMQYLESYNWAMAGAIMSTILGGGLIALKVLRDKEVLAGFAEGIPDYDPIKQKEIEKRARRRDA